MKVKMQIFKDGSSKIVTIEGAGQNCRAVADSVGKVLGEADEGSRENTPDLYVTGETDQHVEQ